MLLTIKYSISICLIFAAVSLQGQEKKVVKPKKDFSPTGIRVGTDLIALGKTIATNTFSGWELNGDIDFANYYLALDIGSWAKEVALKNGDYSNAGNYYRVGVDINLLGKDPDKNMFFLGFRFGQAAFNESMNYLVTSPYLFPSIITSASNPHATGSWGELTTGLRVKVWKGLALGYTARMKIAPHVSGSANFATYDMPGYGIVQKKPYWGFNYQVFWRFAWKKDKAAPTKK